MTIFQVLKSPARSDCAMKLSPDDSRWVNCLRASAESLKDSVLPYKLYSVEEKILAISLVAGQFYLPMFEMGCQDDAKMALWLGKEAKIRKSIGVRVC